MDLAIKYSGLLAIIVTWAFIIFKIIQLDNIELYVCLWAIKINIDIAILDNRATPQVQFETCHISNELVVKQFLLQVEVI